jgi:hypothetical protein
MKNVMLVMQGSDLQKLESFIQEMPFKYAQPLLEELGKHVKEIEEQTSAEEVKETKLKK